MTEDTYYYYVDNRKLYVYYDPVWDDIQLSPFSEYEKKENIFSWSPDGKSVCIEYNWVNNNYDYIGDL